MRSTPMWERLHEHYRAREMKVVAGWLAAGENGTVVGLPGAGRSTLLEFLCHRPEMLQRYLPSSTPDLVLLPVDLNNLPDRRLATFYRLLLRAFEENQARFSRTLQRLIRDVYHENRAERDPFLPQGGLRRLLLTLREQGTRVVLVLNRFDDFCRVARPQMTGTLLGLRDSFKETLSYVAGMRREAVYFSDLPAIDPLYQLLDTHVCRVGALDEADARQMITHRTEMAAHRPLREEEVVRLLQLSGGFPSLLRLLCQSWRATSEPLLGATADRWLGRRSFEYRLGALWSWLTQEEQQLLCETQKLQVMRSPAGERKKRFEALEEKHSPLLERLAALGLLRPGNGSWCLSGELLAAFVARAHGRSRGRLWFDGDSGLVYQGTTPVDNLQPLEQAVLEFFLAQPRSRHTHTTIIEAAWPAHTVPAGVSTEALYQVIRGVRKKIEPDPAHPVYLITWRGTPEGGYQLFPEGRPG